ncbi:MAG: flippase-like domain-containing protein [Alphaproteobacteria bacterium]|nr:flippase-like domain-containing protein [Alphaproteobacteria bacterium]
MSAADTPPGAQAPRSKRKALILWGVRAFVSIAVLAIAFAIVSPQAVWRAVLSVGPGLWLAALAVFLGGHVISAWKWRMLTDPHARFMTYLRAHFSGLAANMALPGAASGDIVRAGVLFKDSQNRAALAVGSVAERLIDILGLMIFSLVGFIVAQRAGSDAQLMIWLSVCVAGAFIAALASRPLIGVALKLLPQTGKIAQIGRKLGEAALELTRRPDRLLVCLIVSMAVQVVFVQVNAAMGEAAGVQVSLAAWFFAWPLSKIISTLPISAGGVGVREASLAGLLAPFGADPAAVVAAGLVWQSIVIAGSLGGAAALWALRRPVSSQGAAPHGA